MRYIKMSLDDFCKAIANTVSAIGKEKKIAAIAVWELPGINRYGNFNDVMATAYDKENNEVMTWKVSDANTIPYDIVWSTAVIKRNGELHAAD